MLIVIIPSSDWSRPQLLSTFDTEEVDCQHILRSQVLEDYNEE